MDSIYHTCDIVDLHFGVGDVGIQLVRVGERSLQVIHNICSAGLYQHEPAGRVQKCCSVLGVAAADVMHHTSVADAHHYWIVSGIVLDQHQLTVGADRHSFRHISTVCQEAVEVVELGEGTVESMDV